MAHVFQTFKKQRDPATGRLVPLVDAKGQAVAHPRWRGEYVDWRGRRHVITLTTNRKDSEKMLASLALKAHEIRIGHRPAPSATEQAARRPIAEVMAEYLAWGNTQGGRGGRPWAKINAAKRRYYLDWWKRALAAETLADLHDALPRAERALQSIAAKGRSGKTLAMYREGLFAFCLWCKQRRYLRENPFEGMAQFNMEPIRIRRAMSLAEIHRLLAACPPSRALLYETDFASGFRVSELRSLSVDSLDRVHHGLHLSAEADKGRKERFQPLTPELTERLYAYARTGEPRELYEKYFARSGRPVSAEIPAEPLLYVPSHPARTIQVDLRKAGIPLTTAEGVLDFHACRTAYINLVLDVEDHTKTIQDLTRHAQLGTTGRSYARSKRERTAATAERIGRMVNPGTNGIPTERVGTTPETKNATACIASGCANKILVPASRCG